jgi:trehalose 6-phosphate phosphatase
MASAQTMPRRPRSPTGSLNLICDGPMHPHDPTARSADWALFLDFDGTLVEIAERPESVVVDQGLPGTLTRLQDRLGGALAIVSGRPIAFLDERLGLPFDAAGLHGIEHRIAGRFSRCRPDDHPRLRDQVSRLRDVVDSHPGMLIEDKGCSVAVHWRMAPDKAAFALALAREAADELGPDYRIQFGKAVAEILPAASGKGRVIEMFLTQAPYQGRRPIFIGDDLTDELGFAVVNAIGGLSIRIGAGDTIAGERLDNPAALRRHLLQWAEEGAIPFSSTGAL